MINTGTKFRLKKELVNIIFLDHALSHGKDLNPVHCEVVGYLVNEDKRAYYVAPWICDSQVDNEDTDIYVIVKHPGLKIKRLKGN